MQNQATQTIKDRIGEGTIINVFKDGTFVQSTILKKAHNELFTMSNYWTDDYVMRADKNGILEGLKKRFYRFGAPRPSASPSDYDKLKIELGKIGMEAI